MPNIKDLLNKIKWTKDLEKVKIWYLHRGAPNDTKILSGVEIKKINRSSLETETSNIPYHRIFKIFYGDKIIFKR